MSEAKSYERGELTRRGNRLFEEQIRAKLPEGVAPHAFFRSSSRISPDAPRPRRVACSSCPLPRVHGAAFRALHAQNVSPEEGGSGEDFPRLDDLDRPADAVPGGGASEGRASRNCFDFDASACDVADVQIAVP